MPLHDAVGINCEKGATTGYHSQMSNICAKGYMLMIVCLLSDLTWLPLLGGGRMHGILLLQLYHRIFKRQGLPKY